MAGGQDARDPSASPSGDPPYFLTYDREHWPGSTLRTGSPGVPTQTPSSFQEEAEARNEDWSTSELGEAGRALCSLS